MKEGMKEGRKEDEGRTEDEGRNGDEGRKQKMKEGRKKRMEMKIKHAFRAFRAAATFFL